MDGIFDKFFYDNCSVFLYDIKFCELWCNGNIWINSVSIIDVIFLKKK